VSAPRLLAYGLHLGARLPAHATSTGRVLLAALASSELDPWLDGRPLARLTAHTVTDPSALTALLTQVRQQDYCIASEEHELGVHALAVPLRDLGGRTVGALNAVLTTNRMATGSIQRELLPLLREAALELQPLL
jgi:IclR family pca regulon transcriptional regulator